MRSCRNNFLIKLIHFLGNFRGAATRNFFDCSHPMLLYRPGLIRSGE